MIHRVIHERRLNQQPDKNLGFFETIIKLEPDFGLFIIAYGNGLVVDQR